MELSIEEKAKAYDESKARMKAAWDSNRCTLGFMNEIFPELKESKDEKIRKDILSFAENMLKNNISKAQKDKFKFWISWLEKQGEKSLVNFDEVEKEKYNFVSGQYIECRASFNEFKKDNSYWLEYVGDDTYIGRSDNILNQKFHITPRQLYSLFTQQHCLKEDNANKVEPKFKIGDWVVRKDGKDFFNNRKTVQITKIDGEQYWFDCETWLDAKDIRLWTVADAKDGDILCVNDEVFIYDHRKQLYNIAVAHCFVDSAGGFYIEGEFLYTEKGNSIHPATKEQCNVLFVKMYDAGYSWRVKDKQLIKR